MKRIVILFLISCVLVCSVSAHDTRTDKPVIAEINKGDIIDTHFQIFTSEQDFRRWKTVNPKLKIFKIVFFIANDYTGPLGVRENCLHVLVLFNPLPQ